MRPLVDPSTIVLVVLALVLAAVAYLKDPGRPLIGAKNGFSMLRFILQRRHQARQDEPEHREAVLRAHEREPRILQVRDRPEHDRQHTQERRGRTAQWAQRAT